MIIVHECKISSDNKNLLISVETDLGYIFTDINLWDENSFKIESIKKNLNPLKVSNREDLIIPAAQVGLKSFHGIYFIEFNSNAPLPDCATCPTPLTAVVTNLIPYYRCAMDSILKSSLSHSEPCMSCISTDREINKVIAIHLLIDGINEAVEVNRFVDAINMLNNLKKLCINCSESSSENIVNCSECSKTSLYYH